MEPAFTQPAFRSFESARGALDVAFDDVPAPQLVTAILIACAPEVSEVELWELPVGRRIECLLVVLNEDPSGRNPYQRMTLTLSALARGRLAIITVSGEEKREMMQRVAAGEEVPASRVQAERIVWLVDEAAAP